MYTKSRLSLARIPPISVPLRFLLTVPLFGIFAAGLLIGYGPDAIANRWTPPLLGATHLLTLGYVSMAMVGAMSQMLAVLAGSPLPLPRITGAVIHTMLTTGALALVSGFLTAYGWLISLAILTLGLALMLFLGAAFVSLARSPSRNPTTSGMRLALASLAVSAAVGLSVALNHIGALTSPISSSFTNVHLAWGLVGWVSILVISVAYEVVPMFQVTPNYPHWMQRWVAWSMFVCLVLWSGSYVLSSSSSRLQDLLAGLLSMSLASGLTSFAVTTLYLQHHRRRRLSDVTLLYWRTSMLALLCSSSIWIVAQFWPSLTAWRQFPFLLGVLFIIGFSISVINGMLYKIVPFLVWLHLQSYNKGRVSLPNIKEIIPDTRARRQFYMHVAALLLLAGALLEPDWFFYPAAILFALSFLYLAFNLFAALRVYRKVKAALTMAD